MGHGGRRAGAGGKPGQPHDPGPGRTPTRKVYDTPIRRAERRICDRLPFLIDKLFELAEGVCVEREDKEGNTFVYREKPDFKALSYLVDRIMGRPTQPVTLVDAVRTIAMREGLTDDEVEAAVAEAERITKMPRLHAGS